MRSRIILSCVSLLPRTQPPPWKYITTGSGPFECGGRNMRTDTSPVGPTGNTLSSMSAGNFVTGFGLSVFEHLARIFVRKLIDGLSFLCGQGIDKGSASLVLELLFL